MYVPGTKIQATSCEYVFGAGPTLPPFSRAPHASVGPTRTAISLRKRSSLATCASKAIARSEGPIDVLDEEIAKQNRASAAVGELVKTPR